MEIRKAIAADLPALELVIASTGLFPPELLAGMMESYLANPDGPDQWLTIRQEEQVIAVAYFAPERLTEGTWNLYLIAIEAGHQGHGRTIMQYVEEQLRSASQRLLLVETSGLPEFQYQRDFYARCGYVHEATIRDFYEPGNDKIVFWKTL